MTDDVQSDGAMRLLALLRDCSTRLGPTTRLRTIAVLAQVARLGPGPIRCIAKGLKASEAAVRYDLKRLGDIDRYGRRGLRMVSETTDNVTGEVTYRLTAFGEETVAAILLHLPPPPPN